MRGGMTDAGGASPTSTVPDLPASSRYSGFRFANWDQPIFMVLAPWLSSPRSPEGPMGIFSPAENWRRGAADLPHTCSGGYFVRFQSSLPARGRVAQSGCNVFVMRARGWVPCRVAIGISARCDVGLDIGAADRHMLVGLNVSSRSHRHYAPGPFWTSWRGSGQSSNAESQIAMIRDHCGARPVVGNISGAFFDPRTAVRVTTH